MGAEVSASAGVASFLDRLAANFARLTLTAIDIKMGDKASHGAVAPSIITRRGSFLLDRELKDFDNIVSQIFYLRRL
jgi:hypothetical protein